MGLLYAELVAAVDAIAVVLGGLFGCVVRRGIPDKIGRAIFLGVTGMTSGKKPLIAVLSLSVGTVIGTNMPGIMRIKRARPIPAMFLPLLFCLIPFYLFM